MLFKHEFVFKLINKEAAHIHTLCVTFLCEHDVEWNMPNPLTEPFNEGALERFEQEELKKKSKKLHWEIKLKAKALEILKEKVKHYNEKFKKDIKVEDYKIVKKHFEEQCCFVNKNAFNEDKNLKLMGIEGCKKVCFKLCKMNHKEMQMHAMPEFKHSMQHVEFAISEHKIPPQPEHKAHHVEHMVKVEGKTYYCNLLAYYDTAMIKGESMIGGYNRMYGGNDDDDDYNSYRRKKGHHEDLRYF